MRWGQGYAEVLDRVHLKRVNPQPTARERRPQDYTSHIRHMQGYTSHNPLPGSEGFKTTRVTFAEKGEGVRVPRWKRVGVEGRLLLRKVDPPDPQLPVLVESWRVDLLESLGISDLLRVSVSKRPRFVRQPSCWGWGSTLIPNPLPAREGVRIIRVTFASCGSLGLSNRDLLRVSVSKRPRNGRRQRVGVGGRPRPHIEALIIHKHSSRKFTTQNNRD